MERAALVQLASNEELKSIQLFKVRCSLIQKY